MDIRQVMVRKAFGPRNCKEAAQKQRTNSSVWAPVVMLWQKGCWKIHMHVSRGVLNRSRGSERVTDCILCTVLWTGHWILVYNSVVHLKKKKKDKWEKVQKGTTKMIEGLERLIMRDERTPSIWFTKGETGRWLDYCECILPREENTGN